MKFAIGSILHQSIREMEAWVLFPYPFCYWRKQKEFLNILLLRSVHQ